MPGGGAYTASATSWGSTCVERIKAPWTTVNTPESVSSTRVDLGDMPAMSHTMIMVSAPIDADSTAYLDTYEARAHLSGSYAQGAGCQVSLPPVPATPQEGRCEQVLAGRTVRSLSAGDIEVRDKSGDGGETNADGWGAAPTPIFRLYGATDRELTDVTYTAKAAQGVVFTSHDSFGSPAAGRLTWPSAGAYTGAVQGASEPVISADGRTASITFAKLPAKSSFSFNVVGKVDGSGAAMVLDHVLAGSLTGCAATPTTPPAPTTPAPTTPSTPAPTTPAPTRPSTPAPTVPAPAKPTTPATPAPANRVVVPAKPAAKTVTRTFQVDRYTPRTAAQAAVVARLDDDGRLRYREDRALWGASRHQFVRVTVPARATNDQVAAAINRATGRAVGDIATGARLRTAAKGRAYVIAWELGRGATTKAAWGPRTNVAQTFFGRS